MKSLGSEDVGSPIYKTIFSGQKSLTMFTSSCFNNYSI